MCVQWEILLGGASFVSLAGQHPFLDKTTIARLLYINISVDIFRIGPKKVGFTYFTDKHMSIYE